jgi:hypothetical protein
MQRPVRVAGGGRRGLFSNTEETDRDSNQVPPDCSAQVVFRTPRCR